MSASRIAPGMTPVFLRSRSSLQSTAVICFAASSWSTSSTVRLGISAAAGFAAGAAEDAVAAGAGFDFEQPAAASDSTAATRARRMAGTIAHGPLDVDVDPLARRGADEQRAIGADRA